MSDAGERVWAVAAGRRGRRLAVGLAAVLFVLDGALHASGGIEGRVTRQDGTPLGGVTVVLSGTGTCAAPAAPGCAGGATTLTDAQGRYAFPDVDAGSFSVSFVLGPNTVTEPRVVVGEQRVTLDRVVNWTIGYAETVTTYAAARQVQRLFDAPASVTVIPEAAIAAEAASAQLPKVLESAAGVELAQSGVFDFNVNIRGLNNTLNRRVLTLVDGRDPSAVLIGAQEWAAFSLPLDEIARIEVVRGAGSALYGVNAFNGVIDIASKEPRYSPGGHADISVGEIGTFRAAARHAGALKARSFYRVHASFGRTDDFYRARNLTVEYAGLPPEPIAPPHDSTEFVNIGGRLDHYLSVNSPMTVEGGWTRSKGNMLLSSAGRSQSDGVQRPWLRAAVQTSGWRVSGYYDGRRGSMSSLASGVPVVDDSLKASGDAVHTRRYADAGTVVVGAVYRYQRADTRNDAGVSTILRSVHAGHEGSLFGQVDQRFGDRLTLTGSARFDGSTLYRREFSPKATVVYAVNPGHSMRLTYGQAFEAGTFIHYFLRTPVAPPAPLGAIEAALAPALGGTPLQLGSVPVLALGNEDLDNERVRTIEGGYTGVVGRRLVVGASYYFNRVRDLITPLLSQVGTPFGRINPAYGPYQPPSTLSASQQALVLSTLRAVLPAPTFALLSNDLDGRPIIAAVSFTNFARVNVQGAEVSAQYFAGTRVMADAAYSWLDFMPQGGVSPDVISANAPAHRVGGGVTYTAGRLTTAVRGRWSSEFVWNTGIYRGPVPATGLVDLTARYRLTPRTAVTVNVANLFDNDHYQVFGGDVLERRSLVTLSQSW